MTTSKTVDRHYSDLAAWSNAVKAQGCKVKKMSVSKYNTYYVALNHGTMVGFFNDWEPESSRLPGGTLTIPKVLLEQPTVMSLNDRVLAWANAYRKAARDGDEVEEGKQMLAGQELIDVWAPGQKIESIQDYENVDDACGNGVHIQLVCGVTIYIPL